MIRTYLLEYSSLPDPLEQETDMEKLPVERIEKIARLKQPDARKQCFGAGLLLNYVQKKAGAGAQISYNRFGKPFVEGIPFSLSHTEHYVMLSMWEAGQYHAEDDGEEVLTGCDMEHLRPYHPKTARRFFTRAEFQNLEAAAGGQEQAELFCRYWTRKESVMKLTGLGMALPMDFFDVRAGRAVADLEKIKGWNMLQKEERQTEYTKAAEILRHRQLFFKEYWHDSCCMTVCSTQDEFAAEVQKIKNNRVLSM